MYRDDRKKALGLLDGLAAPDASLEEWRAALDSLAQIFPVPAGTQVQAGNVGGIEGEWVRAMGVSRTDAVILYLHGGGFVLGSPRSHRHLVEALGAAAGMAAFVADYRRAPESRFPVAVEDAVAAYTGLLASGTAPGKIAVIGDSAGGGLTMAMQIMARDRGHPLPGCAVVLSPWADLTQTAEAYETRIARSGAVQKQGLDQMSAIYLNGVDRRSPLASPVFADLTGLPPLLIQVGTEEVLHDDSTALQRQADAAGVEASLEIWSQMPHVWHLSHPVLGEGRDAIDRIGRFVRGHIG